MNIKILTVLAAAYCCASAQAQNFESFRQMFTGSKYQVSSEIYFLIEQNGKWVPRPNDGHADKAVLEYGQDGPTQAFRSVRYLGSGEIDFQAHSIWDGKMLKTMISKGGKTSIFVKKSLSDMELASQMANMPALPWLWLAVSSPGDICTTGTPASGLKEEIKNRFSAMAPLLRGGDFIELPYAKDVLCKVTMRGDGSIERFVLRSKSGKIERSIEVVQSKDLLADSGESVTIPVKIIDTMFIEGCPRAQRTHNFLKMSIGSTVSKDIFRLDVPKAASFYNEETREYLPIK